MLSLSSLVIVVVSASMFASACIAGLVIIDTYKAVKRKSIRHDVNVHNKRWQKMMDKWG